MTDRSKNHDHPPPPPDPPSPEAERPAPRSLMRADERLIGSSIVMSGATLSDVERKNRKMSKKSKKKKS